MVELLKLAVDTDGLKLFLHAEDHPRFAALAAADEGCFVKAIARMATARASAERMATSRCSHVDAVLLQGGGGPHGPRIMANIAKSPSSHERLSFHEYPSLDDTPCLGRQTRA